CHRWGDYSSMSVDPSDGCTFWYTTEYFTNQTNGTNTPPIWSTRIGSFKFPSCAGATSDSITCMHPDSATRCYNNYSQWSPVYQSSADACRNYCNSNNAQACEWNSGTGDCYVEFGASCLQSGFPGWYAGVAGDSCSSPWPTPTPTQPPPPTPRPPPPPPRPPPPTPPPPQPP